MGSLYSENEVKIYTSSIVCLLSNDLYVSFMNPLKGILKIIEKVNLRIFY